MWLVFIYETKLYKYTMRVACSFLYCKEKPCFLFENPKKITSKQMLIKQYNLGARLLIYFYYVKKNALQWCALQYCYVIQFIASNCLLTLKYFEK